MDVCTYNKYNFKPQISSILNFEYVNKVWMSGVLCVKAVHCGLEGCEFESLPSHISFTLFQKALKLIKMW